MSARGRPWDMTEAASPLRHIILSLRYGSEAERLHAAISMRNPYIEANDKGVIKEAGGIQALLQLLDQNNQALAVASAETLACLAAEDAEIRVTHHDVSISGSKHCRIYPPLELINLVQIWYIGSVSEKFIAIGSYGSSIWAFTFAFQYWGVHHKLLGHACDLQEAIRALNGIELFVRLVSASIEIDCTQRALLALRILTESEADRLAIVKVTRTSRAPKQYRQPRLVHLCTCNEMLRRCYIGHKLSHHAKMVSWLLTGWRCGKASDSALGGAYKWRDRICNRCPWGPCSWRTFCQGCYQRGDHPCLSNSAGAFGLSHNLNPGMQAERTKLAIYAILNDF